MTNIFELFTFTKGKYVRNSFLCIVAIAFVEAILGYTIIQNGQAYWVSKLSTILLIGSYVMSFCFFQQNTQRAEHFYNSPVFTRVLLLPEKNRKHLPLRYMMYEMLFSLMGVLWIYLAQVVVNFFFAYFMNQYGIFTDYTWQFNLLLLKQGSFPIFVIDSLQQLLFSFLIILVCSVYASIFALGFVEKRKHHVHHKVQDAIIMILLTCMIPVLFRLNFMSYHMTIWGFAIVLLTYVYYLNAKRFFK